MRRTYAVQLRSIIFSSVTAALLTFLCWPTAALAQRAVVANFAGKGKAVKAAAASREAILKALDKQGVTVVAFKQYQQQATKLRLKGAAALSPKGIAKVCAKMNLDAVVTGSAALKGKKVMVTVTVFDGKGKLITRKALQVAGALSPAQAEQIASAVAAKGGGAAVAAAPAAAEPPAVEEPAAESPPPETTAPSTTLDLPAWARAPEEAPAAGEGEPAATAIPAPGSTPETTAVESLPLREHKLTGCVPDILVDAGMSGNLRGGLHPRHESGLYPGVRVDIRAFLGSFLDTVVVKDIGLGGMFHMGLGLKYGLEGGEKWDSSMMQWQAELNYRLALNEVRPLQPAFLLRVGYGSTVNTIDSTSNIALSVGYVYPYAAADIYLMLWEPYLRLLISGGYLFTVAGAKDLSGSGNGFTVRGGVDCVLFEQLYIGIGYEMFQFLGLKTAANTVSDTFQTFFLRVGWNYR